MFVIEKESEALRGVGVTDDDFNEAVTEVQEEAIARSALNVPAAEYVSGRGTRVAAALAANVLNDVVQTECLQQMVEAERESPARDPR